MVLLGYLKTGQIVQMYECQRQKYKDSGDIKSL